MISPFSPLQTDGLSRQNSFDERVHTLDERADPPAQTAPSMGEHFAPLQSQTPDRITLNEMLQVVNALSQGADWRRDEAVAKIEIIARRCATLPDVVQNCQTFMRNRQHVQLDLIRQALTSAQMDTASTARGNPEDFETPQKQETSCVQFTALAGSSSTVSKRVPDIDPKLHKTYAKLSHEKLSETIRGMADQLTWYATGPAAVTALKDKVSAESALAGLCDRYIARRDKRSFEDVCDRLEMGTENASQDPPRKKARRHGPSSTSTGSSETPTSSSSAPSSMNRDFFTNIWHSMSGTPLSIGDIEKLCQSFIKNPDASPESLATRLKLPAGKTKRAAEVIGCSCGVALPGPAMNRFLQHCLTHDVDTDALIRDFVDITGHRGLFNPGAIKEVGAAIDRFKKNHQAPQPGCVPGQCTARELVPYIDPSCRHAGAAFAMVYGGAYFEPLAKADDDYREYRMSLPEHQRFEHLCQAKNLPEPAAPTGGAFDEQVRAAMRLPLSQATVARCCELLNKNPNLSPLALGRAAQISTAAAGSVKKAAGQLCASGCESRVVHELLKSRFLGPQTRAGLISRLTQLSNITYNSDALEELCETAVRFRASSPGIIDTPFALGDLVPHIDETKPCAGAVFAMLTQDPRYFVPLATANAEFRRRRGLPGDVGPARER